MKVKHFVLLCVVALIIILNSLLLTEQQAGESEFEHQSFIANFDLSQLDKLSIWHQKNTVVLARDGKNWGLPEHHDYGIDLEKLKKLVQKLQVAKIVELKTRDPKKLARLGLSDDKQSELQGTLVELQQNSQTFSFLLGVNANGHSGQYARVAGDNQSYLLDQRFDLSTSHTDWIDTSIFMLTEADITELNWSKGDETFVIKKNKPDAEFELIQPSIEQTPQYPSIFTGLVRNLVNTEAEDIKPLNNKEITNLSLGFSIQLTEAEKSKVQQVNVYQDNAEKYWLQIEGRNWLYQISSFSFNQLGKSLAEYLTQEE
jgi:hypothetical protein